MSLNKKKIAMIILGILILIVVGALIYGNSLLGKVSKKQLPKDNASLGISNENGEKESEKEKDIINIALFGRDGSDQRTDSIMVVTIDKVNKTIKLTSLLRDMYIDLPGYGKGILNHAYLKGGPELAIKTINTNFGLDITDYIAVNMDGFIKIIDSIGGVQLNVEAEEISYINSYAKGMAEKINYKEFNNLTKPGTQNLNGVQAMAYSRIRKIGRDFGRTERQRTVLNDVFKKVKDQGVLKLPGTISTMLPYVETSLSNNDIIKLSSTIIGFNNNKLEQFHLPVNGLYKDEFIDDMFVLTLDLQGNKNKLHEFIYGK